MKRKYFLFTTLCAFGLFFTSCKSTGIQDGDQTKEDTTVVKTEHNENCTYIYDNTSTEVGFTSYKFTKRTGVGGVFNDFVVSGAEKDKDPLNVIQNLSIVIPTATINTNNPDRDAKIAKFFFGTVGIDTIQGKVISIDASTQKTTMLITMNGKSNMVEGTYTFEGDTYSFSADIDVSNWDATDGISALNEECKDLHTGEDGISKLWPEVTITFTTTFKKDCQ